MAVISSEPVLDAGALYRGFRRGEPRAAEAGVELHRLHFESHARGLLLPEDEGWEENTRFVYPLFLPAGGGPFRDAVVILNGLNDNSFRKFFPWGASLARAGIPALVFPSALLINRRPRAWISQQGTERALLERLAVAPDSATPINAAMSARVAARPHCLLHDALHTIADLRVLGTLLGAGELALQGGVRPFVRGTRVHLLGYSLGGYLAIALRLCEPAFARAHVIALCAGASVAAQPPARLDPVSPYIVDRAAAEAAIAALPQLLAADRVFPDPAVATLLLELLTGTRPATRARIAGLGDQLTLLGSSCDRVVPAPGIEANLGRVDELLQVSHEYPFTLVAPSGRDETRAIAQSHRIAPQFEPAFRRFVQAALRGLPSRDHIAMPPLTPITWPVT